MCSRLTARHPLQSAAPIGRTVYWPHDFTSATSLSTSSKTLSFLAPSAACIAIRTISRFRRYVLCITSADSSTRSSISRLIRKAGPLTFDTSNISDTKSESSIPSNSDPSNLRKPDPRYLTQIASPKHTPSAWMMLTKPTRGLITFQILFRSPATLHKPQPVIPH